MEIFNIHIFEFVIIAAIALVIFGPERLPEVGRFFGKQVARVLAWQQQSPEIQMVQEMRAELEREIVSLRDEMVRTRQQLNVTKDFEQLNKDTKALLDFKNNPLKITPAAQAQAQGQTKPDEPIAQDTPDSATNVEAAQAADSTEAPSTAQAADAQSALSPERVASNGEHPTLDTTVRDAKAATTTTTSADTTTLDVPAMEEHSIGRKRPEPTIEHDDRQLLLRQLQFLIADMQALQENLKERGVLDHDWTPPSQVREGEPVL